MIDEPDWCVLGNGYCNECLECITQNKELES